MGTLLREGRAAGLFRRDVDIAALYVALSGLGYFYCSNRWTRSTAFAGDLFAPARMARYEAMIADMVVAYLETPDKPAPGPVAPPRQPRGQRLRVAAHAGRSPRRTSG